MSVPLAQSNPNKHNITNHHKSSIFLSTMIEKRPKTKRAYYKDIRRSPNRRTRRPRISQAVVIEAEENNDSRINDRSNSKYKRRHDTCLLNLLVRAVLESNIASNEESTSILKIQDGRRNILGRNSFAMASVKSVSFMKSIGSSPPRKRVIDKIPPDDLLQPASSDHDLCETLLSPLPKGRPLMAPPCLPTHLIPRRV